jgi:hypothetical protein
MGCEGEMSLLGLDASCIVGSAQAGQIGWLCDTSCVGRFVDAAAGRRWSSTNNKHCIICTSAPFLGFGARTTSCQECELHCTPSNGILIVPEYSALFGVQRNT